jgi:hypothetical protein
MTSPTSVCLSSNDKSIEMGYQIGNGGTYEVIRVIRG